MSKGRVRNVFGTAAPSQDHYNGIKFTPPSADSNPLRANKTRFAFPWRARGTLCLVKLRDDSPGAVPDDAPMLEQEESIVDFDFAPFDDNLIAACGDTSVNVWRVPDDELPAGLAPIHSLQSPHDKRMVSIGFHPLADNVMLTTAMDKVIKFWDLENGCTERLSVTGHGDGISSITWNHSGTTMATTCKDKKLRIIDPRSGTIGAETVCHEGAKASRAVWLGDREQILTTGFKKGAQDREVALFDARNLSSRVASLDIDSIPSSLFPFFDADLGLVYLVGKGDGNIRVFELVDGAKPLEAVGEFRSPQAQAGFAMLPKVSCDVMRCEITRFLKLQGNSVVPIRFAVTRQNLGHQFHADLFPDTFDGKPVYTASEWYGGAEGRVGGRMSLNPEAKH